MRSLCLDITTLGIGIERSSLYALLVVHLLEREAILNMTSLWCHSHKLLQQPVTPACSAWPLLSFAFFCSFLHTAIWKYYKIKRSGDTRKSKDLTASWNNNHCQTAEIARIVNKIMWQEFNNIVNVTTAPCTNYPQRRTSNHTSRLL